MLSKRQLLVFHRLPLLLTLLATAATHGLGSSKPFPLPSLRLQYNGTIYLHRVPPLTHLSLDHTLTPHPPTPPYPLPSVYFLTTGQWHRVPPLTNLPAVQGTLTLTLHPLPLSYSSSRQDNGTIYLHRVPLFTDLPAVQGH